MEAFKSLLSPLGMQTSNAIQDTLKLVVLGGTVETARRMSASAWNGFVESFFLTAHFSQEDYPHDCREFDITTRTVGRNTITTTTAGDLEEDEDESDEVLVHGRKKRKVAFMPSMDTTHTIYYHGHWLRITRSKRCQDYGYCSELKISVVARSNDILKKLVLEAKREYEKDAEHRVHIFMADTSYGCWRWNGARQKRPMSSIVLEPGVKEMLLSDCKDFLQSEDWYAERGIPFRRGYLLYGVPGSGKTSLIHSLAGELGLDIYVVSLSSKGMSDNTLANLMGNVPSRCILLLEDLDAAFTRSVSRDSGSTGAPPASGTATASETKDQASDGSTLSLSGLLNSLDGVAAAEGRLLFATTNHIERLDPALSRPGRMDVWVNFKHATKFQAEGIFKCFFPCKKSAADATPSSSKTSSSTPSADDVSQTNVPGSKRKPHIVNLLSEEEISGLAKRFADAIPEDELSVAALQGYLLKNKTRPRECVDEVHEWIKQERETRDRLKKEKEEKEEKEAKEVRSSSKAERAEKKEARLKSKRMSSRSVEVTSSKAETPTSDVAVSPVEESSSESSSSEVDGTSTGADADTEESVTSEEETEKPMETQEPAKDAKEKWVAVKGQQTATPEVNAKACA
ncbi:P-loop containing nucleoside triphosphate hydrolase protein [Gloeophyllum trabeum ATCC 11539]|uniref:p-loop containing nucleoside triphosphate hydrolase protein n=1 Tax=Gloeophyllum trabeum (strain ATCC 11539 / FP-39264 / Madison 617) TaxID=670483 RepID=S7RNU6_GLOTA|nr:P-loop containing nucleoside triphosphate hydrolase protein [Gloeophyllum trabeum ATCC 11539]EPQ56200.1 P-loop containing nucleoside triphosphate hydrolase protein [Gloeophyllum trabeum ATCC 11539]